MTVRVFIVDDHELFREGVRARLAGDGRVEVVGDADEASAAIELIVERVPDVVLLDVNLPGGGGAAVARAIDDPRIRFLALSASDAREDVVGVVRAGAAGYVTKTIQADELVDAVCTVAEGGAVFSPSLAGYVLEAFADVEPADVDEDLDRLTSRELEVLRLIARGYTYREIGERLFISIKTVETHVSHVLKKLQMSNRHELTRWAVDRRLD